MYIGKSNWPNDAYFDGYIDEFAFFQRILSPSEINSIFTSSVSSILSIQCDFCKGNRGTGSGAIGIPSCTC